MWVNVIKARLHVSLRQCWSVVTPLCGLGRPLNHCWEHLLVYNLHLLTFWPWSKAIFACWINKFLLLSLPLVVATCSVTMEIPPFYVWLLPNPTNLKGTTHDEFLFARLIKIIKLPTGNTLMIHCWYLFSFSCRQRSKPITHDQFLKHKFGKFR